MLFLAQLSKHLGFFPQQINLNAQNVYFDLQEGFFSNRIPPHKLFINTELSQQLILIFNLSFNELHTININNIDRKLILNALLNYYSLHLSNFDNLKSKEVLEEILS